MTVVEFFGYMVILFLAGGFFRIGYELINHLF